MLRIFGLLPRCSEEWNGEYKKRQIIERYFGSDKHSRMLDTHCCLNGKKVELHVAMSTFACLATALAHLKAYDYVHMRHMRSRLPEVQAEAGDCLPRPRVWLFCPGSRSGVEAHAIADHRGGLVRLWPKNRPFYLRPGVEFHICVPVPTWVGKLLTASASRVKPTLIQSRCGVEPMMPLLDLLPDATELGLTTQPADLGGQLRCADFFCGIGGFHQAAQNLGLQVAFACDIDEEVRRAYQANFDLHPAGDVVSLSTQQVPDHDLLFAGFPCQPFSIIGRQQGFADPRGTLFFELLRFIRAKRPSGIILENVKQLATIQKGAVIQRIKQALAALNYTVDHKVLNALDFGLPQKRERTIIVASQIPFDTFPWPSVKRPMTPLAQILESEPASHHFVSDTIREKRHRMHTAKETPSIWHENKAGNVSSHPYSCALRAGASHNYLLVNGERRLTSREMLRLQGFPDTFEIVCGEAQTRKQLGNAVPVPMVQDVIQRMVKLIGTATVAGRVPAETSLSTWGSS